MSGFKIQNDVGATVFAILSGISALCLTAWVFSPGGCAGPKEGPPITAVPSATVDTSALEKELADAKASLAAESERRVELAGQLRDGKSSLAELKAAKSELEANATALSEKNAELLAKLKAQNSKASNIGADKKKLSALQTQLEGFKTSSADLQVKLDKLTAEKSALEKKLEAAVKVEAPKQAPAPKPAAAPAPKIDTKALDALKAEIAKLKKQLASEQKACADAKAALSAEVDKLKKSLDEAKFGDNLKAAGDFPALDLPFLVNEPIQLNGKVRPVFIELRGMEDTPEALEKVYAKLSADGNTSALHKVPFDSGSADVAAADTTKLNELLKGSPKDAKFLVVGYASADGDAKSNHELSSERASNVAAEIAKIPGVDKNGIQAVYFGQTKRFNANYLSPNRVVEVWRVK